MSHENSSSISATFSPRSEADMAVDDLVASGFDKKEISLKRHVSSAVVTVSGGDPARLSKAAAILQSHSGKVEVSAAGEAAAPPAAPRHPAVEKPGGGPFTPGSSAGGEGAGTAGGGSIFGN